MPGIVGAKTQLERELAGDPPVGLLISRGSYNRLPQRDERLAEGLDIEVVIALEVGGLGQHDIRPPRDLRRNHVHDDEQVERTDGADRFFLVRHRVDQVGRVHEPALDRIRLAGDRRLADARGDRFRRERKAPVRVIHLAA
jgi:hypothetical protein